LKNIARINRITAQNKTIFLHASINFFIFAEPLAELRERRKSISSSVFIPDMIREIFLSRCRAVLKRCP
jgi:hypothetical protein